MHVLIFINILKALRTATTHNSFPFYSLHIYTLDMLSQSSASIRQPKPLHQSSVQLDSSARQKQSLRGSVTPHPSYPSSSPAPRARTALAHTRLEDGDDYVLPFLSARNSSHSRSRTPSLLVPPSIRYGPRPSRTVGTQSPLSPLSMSPKVILERTSSPELSSKNNFVLQLKQVRPRAASLSLPRAPRHSAPSSLQSTLKPSLPMPEQLYTTSSLSSVSSPAAIQSSRTTLSVPSSKTVVERTPSPKISRELMPSPLPGRVHNTPLVISRSLHTPSYALSDVPVHSPSKNAVFDSHSSHNTRNKLSKSKSTRIISSSESGSGSKSDRKKAGRTGSLVRGTYTKNRERVQSLKKRDEEMLQSWRITLKCA
jgi:hypothetical protein